LIWLFIWQKIYKIIVMKKTHTTAYDIADHLRTPQEIAAYLEACFEEADCDAAFIAKAIGDVARAKGMAQIAKNSGLSRESLYKALSGDRNPNLDTVLKVLTSMGLRLRAVPAG
jgi:probable addiction module antidote protein